MKVPQKPRRLMTVNHQTAGARLPDRPETEPRFNFIPAGGHHDAGGAAFLGVIL